MKSFQEFFESMSKKATLLSPTLRNKVNDALSSKKLGSYFAFMPMKKIQEILKKYGILMVQSDGTEWEGFISAGSGYQKEMIDIAFLDSKNEEGVYSIINNSALVLGWEKMEHNGKLEVTCYLS